MFSTLVELLRHRAYSTPAKTAYVFLGDGEAQQRELTYAQLDTRAREIAAYLQSCNVKPGDRILLLHPPGLEFVEALFGCLYSGCIAVPAYAPRMNRHQERLSSIAADCGAGFILSTRAILPKIVTRPEFCTLRVAASDDVTNGISSAWRQPAIEGHSIACLQYTSGSTGTPKGVVLSHQNLLSNAEAEARAVQGSNADTIVSWLPMFHDMGFLVGVIQPVWSEVCAITLPSAAFVQRPVRWLRAITKYGATVSGGPNFSFALCVEKIPEQEKAGLDLSSWRVAFNGAEPVLPQTIDRFVDAFAGCGFRREAFSPCYGLAEATLMVSVKPAGTVPTYKRVPEKALEQNRIEPEVEGEKTKVLVSSGAVLPDSAVAIIDPGNGRPCPCGEIGEVWVSGPGIGGGYWDQPEESARVFRARYHGDQREFLRTGDLGFIADGELFITGRLKDLIIIRGTNHYPQDIEQVVGTSHPLLIPGSCAAFSIEDSEEKLVVVQEVERSAKNADLDPIVASIRAAVATHFELQPYAIVLISPGSIYRTSSGKIQRHACRQGFLTRTLRVWREWVQQVKIPAIELQTAAQPHDRRPPAQIRKWLLDRVSHLLGMEAAEMDCDRPLAEYGLDSKDALSLSGELESFLGTRLPATLLYEYPSINSLAQALGGVKLAKSEPEKYSSNVQETEPIAIVGMACRFPGAETLDEFWRLLCEGRDTVTEVPKNRWDAAALYDGDATVPGKTNSRWGGFLKNIELFDAAFFGISPLEAAWMDPQHRLLLETTLHALEDAGLSRDKMTGAKVASYVGISTNEYAKLFSQDFNALGPYLATGNSSSIAANRLAYAFDWRGASVAVDTACSSSLVAVHLACRTLRDSEAEMAIAAGVNLILSPALAINFSKAGLMSPVGRCKSFSADADGFVRSEGVGVVVLKRMSAAVADKDRIYCVIRGSALSQDGRSNGLMAPSKNAQVSVIREALSNAAVPPEAVQLVEAHGSGTLLGDSIEVDALREVFATNAAMLTRYLGSVKSNIGHAESAAGIAGLIKTALALHHRKIPPSIHFAGTNPGLRLEECGAAVPTRLLAWTSTRPRIAGVSSFGFGGTNAHVVLEEAPAIPGPLAQLPAGSRMHILPISASSPQSFPKMVEKWREYLLHTDALAEDICFTAATRRTHHRFRTALLGHGIEELAERCAVLLKQTNDHGPSSGHARTHPEHRGRVFVFPGHGSQWPGMGRELLQSTVFRSAVERCDKALQPHLGWSVVELLEKGDSTALAEIDVIQPALFALQVGLVALWQSFGIEPDAVVGQSMGEILAAHVAGALDLHDAAFLVCFRGRLLKSIRDRGGMLMTAMSAHEATAFLEEEGHGPRASVAISSSPVASVLSGETDVLAEIAGKLQRKNIFCRVVNIDYASHSRKVDPIRDQLLLGLARLKPRVPALPIYSTVTGAVASDVKHDAEYWWRNLRQPVLFAEAVGELVKNGFSTFVEISPHPLSSVSILEILQGANSEGRVIATLRKNQPEWQALLSALSELYQNGEDIYWENVVPGGKCVSVPLYEFDRKKFWLGSDIKGPGAGTKQRVEPQPSELHANTTKKLRKEGVLLELRFTVAEMLHATPEELDIHAPFLEMGADSIVLMNALTALRTRYGVKLSIRDLFERYTTLDSLADYILQESRADQLEADPADAVQVPPEQASGELRDRSEAQRQAAGGAPSGGGQTSPAEAAQTDFVNLCRRQLDLVSHVISEQLKALSLTANAAKKAPSSDQPELTQKRQPALENSTEPEVTRQTARDGSRVLVEVRPANFIPYSPVEPADAVKLNDKQRHYLQALTSSYTAKTRTSKSRTQRYRRVLADNRTSAGFRYSVKEMLYPIQAERSQGSRIWDVDGNEFIDLTMGFGVHLFGHSAPFLVEAWEQQLALGVQLGPQSHLAGEVAELISSFTGLERVAFTNSGTEAVMTALRIARTANQRSRIAIFAGSYHGTYDGVSARAQEGNVCSAPLAPGILPGAVQDVVVLEYGDPTSLQAIEKHAADFAAVLVEPVQSRRPDLQPKEFLRQLREITARHEIALIFDEVITGFRLAPGGAQEWYGIRADIATYGKVVGGGMPIGVVAGSACYMDAIDGGFWEYGDLSYPTATTTFFAGTFCKHPLAMASARAVLLKLQAEGPRLQHMLNETTSRLADSLNRFFEREGYPVRVAHCGSLFRFQFNGNMDLLFYNLLNRGIYIWEGRNLFLSTAHSAEDLERVQAAVEASCLELERNGLLQRTRVVSGPDIAREDHRSPVKADPTPGPAEISLPSISPAETFPLLESQRQLWILCSSNETASRAYHVNAAIELRGVLQPRRLEDALRFVIERHDILRYRIDKDGDAWEAGSRPPVLRKVSSGEVQRGGGLQAILLHESRSAFDLQSGPLLRAVLIEVEEKHHVFLLSAHHIAIDGASMGILISEVGQAYSRSCQGHAPAAQRRLQFREYVLERTQRQDSAEFAAARSYWLSEFKSLPAPLHLPAESGRPALKTYAGRLHTAIIDSGVEQKLRELGTSHGCTRFMIFFAVFCAFLHRITGQEDLVVGVPVADRSDQSRDVVGYCTNVIPVRSRLAVEDTFLDFLARTRSKLLDAFEHQEYPFSSLIRKLAIEKDPSRLPLVDAIFNLDRATAEAPWHGMEASFQPVPVEAVAFDLELNLTEAGNRVAAEMRCNSDLFSQSGLAGLYENYCTLLRSIAEQPRALLSRLDLVTGAEKRLLLAWNATDRTYQESRCIHEVIEDQARRTPDARAVSFEGETLTFMQLNSRADKLADFLIEQGLGPETTVGICMERSLEMVIAILGVLKAGGAYVPLDPDLPSERLREMQEDSDINILLTQHRLAGRLAEDRLSLLALDASWHQLAATPRYRRAPMSRDYLSYVIFTSGSTGRAKAAMNTHNGLYNRIAWMQEQFLLAPQDKVIQKTPFSFDVSVWEFLWPLMVGAELVMARPGGHHDPLYLQDLISSARITTTHFVPSMLRAFLEQCEPDKCRSLRRVFTSGEALPPELAQQCLTRLGWVELHNLYGPTEAAIDVTHWRCRTDRLPMGVPIGAPIANTQIHVVDRNLEVTPVGVTGEIYIAGAGVGRGYLRRPDLTAERFVPDPFAVVPGARMYRTGDLGRWRRDGNLEFLGRTDSQVKLRGFRIELGEIELALLKCPTVAQAAVLLRDDGPGGKHLAAYVVPASGCSFSAPQLKSFLRDRLPGYMVPGVFVEMQTLPLTGTGKLDRKLLPALDWSTQKDDYIAPRTRSEEILAAIWAAVLKRPQVGIEDNFFELGGDSISALQIVGRAMAAGLQISAQQMFQYQTVAQLAEHARAADAIKPVDAPEEGELPLTPVQHWFFQNIGTDRHHWNQSVVLKIPRGIKPQLLEDSLQVLLSQHDALRLRFSTDQEGKWGQQYGPPRGPERLLESVLLRGKASSENSEFMQQCARFQTSLDLEAGPLIRAVVFETAQNQSMLLLIVHHLAVDAFSWQILLEDLQTLCLRGMDGRPLALPPRTTSYKRWSEALTRMAQSPEIQQQFAWWERLCGFAGAALPRDCEEGNTIALSSTITLLLGADDTRALLELRKTSRVEVQEALAAAILRALKVWTGNSEFLVDMEGHGREPSSDSSGDLDISRTVGWFTSIYPVALKVGGASIRDDVFAMKDQLRGVPSHGMGYGLLRYLHPEGQQRLGGIPQPEILLNYLGQLHSAAEQGDWSLESQRTGSERSPKQSRTHLLEIDAWVAEDKLHLAVDFSRGIFHESTIGAFSGQIVHEVQAVISECRAAGRSYGPSDFPLVRLGALELNRVIAGRTVEDAYPVTSMQHGMLLHSLRAPNSGLYINQQCVSVQGPLDPGRFRRAWQDALVRHAVLRTSFVWQETEEPVQLVEEQVDLPTTEHDWRGLSPAEQSEALETLLKSDRERGFELARGPLMRITLVRTGPESFHVVWTHHHLILDGWSVAIIWREVLEACRSEQSESHRILPEPRPYRDYVEWMQKQDRKAAEAFWRNALAGFTSPTRLEIKSNPGMTHANSATMQRTRRRLTKQRSSQLVEFGHRHRITINSLAQGSWALLMSRYSGKQDILFGATSNGRPSALPGSESMVGLFINTLPVRVGCDPELTALQFLTALQAEQMEAWRYQYSSITEIQGWSSLPRTEALFDTVLVFENYPVEEGLRSGDDHLAVTGLQSKEATNYQLSAQAVSGEEVVLQISYDNQTYEARTIEQLLTHWERILEFFLAEPRAQLSKLQLMSPEERQFLLAEVNNTKRNFLPMGVQQAFEEQVRKSPEAVAVICNEDRICYRDLNKRANQLSRWLRNAGVGPESMVGICLPRGIDLVIAVLGVLKAGGAYVPLEIDHPLERLRYLLEDTSAKVLLTHASLGARFTGISARIICVDQEAELILAQEDSNPAVVREPENLAYVLYTSGSTGKPKGVAIEQQQLMNYICAVHERIGLATYSFAMVQPLSVDSSITALYPPLLCGGSVHIVTREQSLDVSKMEWLFRKDRIEGLKIAPSHLAALHAEGDLVMPARVLIIGGESSQWKWMKQLAAVSPECLVINHYGPTETTVGVLTYKLGEEAPGTEYITSPLGRPLANTQVYVLDENSQPVPQGVAGEIYIGGANVGRGYVNRPDLTAEKFVPDPFSGEPGARLYRTGDRGRWLTDFQLEFLGRFDEQIKIRGYRIELGEIEKVFQSCGEVVQTAVIARSDGTGDPQICAYVVARPGAVIDIERLRTVARQQLPDFMVPRAIIEVPELPRTAHGKLDRAALPAPSVSQSDRYAAPRTPAEELLASMWQQILQVDRVGIDDNFFELGGHSLLATQVVSRIRRIMGVEVPLAALFDTPTVRALAELISHVQAAPDASSNGSPVQKITRADWDGQQLVDRLPLMSESELDALIAEMSQSEADQPSGD